MPASRPGIATLTMLFLTACSTSYQPDHLATDFEFEPDPELAAALPQCRSQTDSVSLAIYCLNLFALSQYREGNSDSAIEYFGKVLELDPQHTAAYEKLGEIYLEQGDNEEAMLAYRSAGRLGSLNPNTYNNLGVAYVHLGDTANAIDSYLKAIQLNPNDARSHFNLGMAYVSDEEKLDLAIEEFELAVSLNPTLAQAHYNLGEIYRHLGQHALANESYRRADQLGFEAARAKIK